MRRPAVGEDCGCSRRLLVTLEVKLGAHEPPLMPFVLSLWPLGVHASMYPKAPILQTMIWT